MFGEFVEALFKAGLPVALLSFALLYWALYRGHVQQTGSMKELEHELKAMSKNKDRPKVRDPLHNKWMKFGGGFYGVVAMLTLAVVEWSDIRQLGFASMAGLVDRLGIDLFIQLLVESFKNFIVAISWPVYWMAELNSRYIWVWLLAAYAGYSGGTHLARYQHQVRKEERRA